MMPIYKYNANLPIANRVDRRIRLPDFALTDFSHAGMHNRSNLEKHPNPSSQAAKSRRAGNSHHWHAIRILASREGFTLIETMVALTLLVGAIIGPLALATSGIFSSKFSKNKLVAINLAQEGLEIIRAYRDNNVLGALAWDALIGNGVRNSDNLCYDIYDCPSTGACLPPTAGTHACASPLQLDPATGIYSYRSGSDSPFTRVITIDRVSDDTVWAANLAKAPGADVMRVVSTVSWSDGAIQRQVQLEEELYNWQ